jgi:hypothetical protein
MSSVTTLQAAHPSRQLEEIKLMDSLYKPGGLLLATQVGTTQPLQIERPSVQGFCEAGGIAAGTPLRCAPYLRRCVLLGKNIYPKLVSEMLGYSSSTSIPLDIY